MRKTNMRCGVLIFVALSITGCSNRAAVINRAESLVRQSGRLKETVKFDRDVEFKNVSVVPGTDMVCGEVRWRNLMGGMGDYWSFHVIGNRPEIAPSPPFAPISGYTTEFDRRHARCSHSL